MMATLSFILFKKKSDIKICVCIRNESLFDCQSKLYTSTAPAVLNIAHFSFTLPQNVACNISGNKLCLKARIQTYICTHLRFSQGANQAMGKSSCLSVRPSLCAATDEVHKKEQ